MAVPGVGPLTAFTFISVVDDPGRFRSSKRVGAHFGLTPKKHQPGETNIIGGITKARGRMVRSMLYEAAQAMLTRTQSVSRLRGVGAASGLSAAQSTLVLSSVCAFVMGPVSRIVLVNTNGGSSPIET